MTIFSRARVTATFKRRSPPACPSAPKLFRNTPCSFRPNVVEKMMTSRSSPCTFSTFFTKSHVFAAFGSLTLAHQRVAEGSLVLGTLFKRVFDRVRLFTVECDDANRGRRRIFPEGAQILDDVRGFLRVCLIL